MKTSPRRVALCLFLLLGSSGLSAAETPASTLATATELLKASGLTPAQLLAGTKTGLSSILELASSELAKPGAVQVATPSSMTKLESMAKKFNQTGAIDAFKSSLNAAAASVAPQAAATMKESVTGLTLDDALALTDGTPDSATRLLRKASEPALRAKLMPLVSQAIAANGTAAKAKDLATKAGPMAAMLGLPTAADLESHVFAQVLDAGFAYVAKGEAAVRANPAALKNAIAAKVFSLGKK
jgi:hypothetical protein